MATPRLRPVQLMVGGFAFAILVGTLLLAAPAASRSGTSIGLLDALFTATSATCVTGLATVDTPTTFTPFGIAVITVLIQLGGIGIMSCAALVALAVSGRIGLGAGLSVAEDRSGSTLGDLKGLVLRIALLCVACEAVGAVALYLALPADAEPPLGRARYAVFHSVSAFCNAGFSLRSDNLVRYADQVGVNLVVMALIVTGGLGFGVLGELGLGLAHRLRRAPGAPPPLSLHSRIVLRMSAGLVVAGALALLLAEQGHTLAGLDVPAATLRALFLSVSARTAGFNSTAIEAMSAAGLWVVIVLMVIGASPGSTGGGIKTTTAAVLTRLALDAGAPGRELVMGGRSIPEEAVRRAAGILLAYLAWVAAGTFSLALVEPAPLGTIVFEVVSALSTVGLSMAFTPTLHPSSKVVIIVLMFVGRVGPLAVAASLKADDLPGTVRFARANDLAVG